MSVPWRPSRKNIARCCWESVRLRFRADVPVGISLSGGLDSCTLLALVQQIQGPLSDVKAFTYVSGDPRYDELPWVQQMLKQTRHPFVCLLLEGRRSARAGPVGRRHTRKSPSADCPRWLTPNCNRVARAEGVIVLFGWARDGRAMGRLRLLCHRVGQRQQAARDGRRAGQHQPLDAARLSPGRIPRAGRRTSSRLGRFPTTLRNMQYRDIRYTKIPRSLRFNDPGVDARVDGAARAVSRPPALRTGPCGNRPSGRIAEGTHKWLLRRVARQLLPAGVVAAPKRPLQTPQREWLRDELRDWTNDCIEEALGRWGGVWLDPDAVRRHWQAYQEGASDNSFYVWQWISLGLTSELLHAEEAQAAAV